MSIKRLLLSVIILLMSISYCYGSFELDDKQLDKFVSAIYIAEGGAKAHHLYGVESLRYSDPHEAWSICRQSVINNYSRWCRAGLSSGDRAAFVKFMAKRYCPGNQRVWAKNVNFYLKKFDK